MLAKKLGDLLGRKIIGPDIFNTAKAGGGSGSEAFDERHFGEKHREIGGELRHGHSC